MAQTYLSYIALFFSVLPSLFGLNAFLRPEATMAQVNFLVPTHPEARKLATSLMRFFGIRNVCTGLLMLLIYFTGDDVQLGRALSICIINATTDGFICKWQTGGGEWAHWGFVPILATLSGSLVGLLG
ncbi:hypothetical protein HJFPF1_12334 [Paramyrothecium foliicola]|nr:hypothetical protein HJFPF1_12334 [Paramyrothecium foliicola]